VKGLPKEWRTLVRRFEQQGLNRIVALHVVQGWGDDPFFDGDSHENMPPNCAAGATVPYAFEALPAPGDGPLMRSFYLTGNEDDRRFFDNLAQEAARLLGRNTLAGFLSLLVDAAWQKQRDRFSLWTEGGMLVRQENTRREICRVEGRLVAEWSNAFLFCADLLPRRWNPSNKNPLQMAIEAMSPEERAALKKHSQAQAEKYRDKIINGARSIDAISEQLENGHRRIAETIERIGQDIEAPDFIEAEPVKALPDSGGGPTDMVGRFTRDEAIDIAKTLMAKEHYITLPKGHPDRKTRREVAKHYDIPFERNRKGKQSLKAMERWAEKPAGKAFFDKFQESREGKQWLQKLQETSEVSAERLGEIEEN
jgi:hypothetical protein